MAKRKAPGESQSEAWNELPWRKLEKYVYRIQKRIYRAKQAGKTKVYCLKDAKGNVSIVDCTFAMEIDSRSTTIYLSI